MKFVMEFDDLKEMEYCIAHLAGRPVPEVPGGLHPGHACESVPAVPVAAVQEAVTPAPVPVSVPATPALAAPAPAPVVPTSTLSYTLDDLARAAMTLMDSGRQEDLVGLLSSLGVDSLPALPPEKYGAFATALRGMGASL